MRKKWYDQRTAHLLLRYQLAENRMKKNVPTLKKNADGVYEVDRSNQPRGSTIDETC